MNTRHKNVHNGKKQGELLRLETKESFLRKKTLVLLVC